MGNLQSVKNALLKLGFEAEITNDPKKINKADKLILPGVGAFKDCFDGLKERGFIDPILNFIESGKPFLGICVGMQLLFEKSYEFGIHEGLGLIKGEVVKFPDEIVKNGLKIPHMGWNTVKKVKDESIFSDIDDNSFFYFVHSYYAPINEDTALVCNYGVDFSAAVVRENVIGVQFHPEKSQKNGLAFLKKFGEL
jgi:glutamine amidotransferase